jgi:hypothetical protein
MVWSSYFDQRSESSTNLGNTLGMQGEYYGLALEQKGNKGVAKKRRQAVRQSNRAFMGAARANSRVWKNPGVGSALLGWEGADEYEGENQLSKIQSAPSVTEVKRPEGASLRKWTT